jgi:hypothetical protein
MIKALFSFLKGMQGGRGEICLSFPFFLNAAIPVLFLFHSLFNYFYPSDGTHFYQFSTTSGVKVSNPFGH